MKLHSTDVKAYLDWYSYTGHS